MLPIRDAKVAREENQREPEDADLTQFLNNFSMNCRNLSRRAAELNRPPTFVLFIRLSQTMNFPDFHHEFT